MVKKLSEIDFLPLVDSILASLATYAIVLPVFLFPVKDKLAMFLSIILPSAYINFVVSGLPVFNAIWDPSEAVVLSILTLANDIVVVPFFLTLAEVHQIRKDPTRKFTRKVVGGIVFRVLTAPVLLGDITGFIWAATGWKIPPYVATLTTIMGDTVLPICLFSAGVFLSQHHFIACHWLKFIVMVILRHIISPILALFFAWTLRFSNRSIRQCGVMSAAPTAVACYLITEAAGIGSGAASTMIFWSTLLSVPAIVGWLAVLDALHLFMD
jgi:predicted permease